MLRIASVTIDCHDVGRVTRFWSEALGYRVTEESDEVGTAEDPKDRDVELVFIQVPEGKTLKNRVHLDIGADDVEVEVERLQQLGAPVLARFPRWTVMADPEGNEFCIVTTDPDDPIEKWRT